MYVDESPKDGNIPDFNISKIDICPFRAYQRSFRLFQSDFSTDIHQRSRLLCFTQNDHTGQTGFKICSFLKWGHDCHLLHGFMQYGGECGQQQAYLCKCTSCQGPDLAQPAFQWSEGDACYDWVGRCQQKLWCVLQNGTKLEFDKKGNLTEIDCKQDIVPAQLIPQAIRNYLKDNYAGQSVKKIEMNKNEYEVELVNGLDLTFNKHFQLIDIDWFKLNPFIWWSPTYLGDLHQMPPPTFQFQHEWRFG